MQSTFRLSVVKSKPQQPIKAKRELKVKLIKMAEARENAGDRVTSGSNFASDWLSLLYLAKRISSH